MKPMGRKVCKVCGEEQYLNMFYANSALNDGHVNTCRACIADKRRRRIERNPPNWRNEIFKTWGTP